MPSPENDLSLLIKLMKMTTAEDNVALVAIRKANEHITNKLNSDWESILSGKVTIIEDPFRNINTNIPPRAAKAPPPQPRAPQSPPPRQQPPFQTPSRPKPQQPPQQPFQPPPNPTRGPTTITYCSLSNGAWGLRSNTSLKPGERVSVTKKNGKVKSEWVGPLIRQAYGDYIYDIGSNPSAPKVDINQLY